VRVLAIETSCDETSAAVVETDGDVPGAATRVLSSIVASQVELHALYGGVVPELASRRHIEAIVPTVAAALSEAKITAADLGGVVLDIPSRIFIREIIAQKGLSSLAGQGRAAHHDRAKHTCHQHT